MAVVTVMPTMPLVAGVALVGGTGLVLAMTFVAAAMTLVAVMALLLPLIAMPGVVFVPGVIVVLIAVGASVLVLRQFPVLAVAAVLDRKVTTAQAMAERDGTSGLAALAPVVADTAVVRVVALLFLVALRAVTPDLLTLMRLVVVPAVASVAVAVMALLGFAPSAPGPRTSGSGCRLLCLVARSLLVVAICQQRDRGVQQPVHVGWVRDGGSGAGLRHLLPDPLDDSSEFGTRRAGHDDDVCLGRAHSRRPATPGDRRFDRQSRRRVADGRNDEHVWTPGRHPEQHLGQVHRNAPSRQA
jgi:hypothetical protein